MASAGGKPSRIHDVVRDSKIHWDGFLEIDRNHDRQRAVGVFPRTQFGEICECYEGRQTRGSKSEYSWRRCHGSTEKRLFDQHSTQAFELKAKFPTFDGSSLKLDFLDWFDTFEDYFEAENLPDAVKCKLVASKLKGEARIWWKELQNRPFSEGEDFINSWPRMRELLLKRFLHTSCLTYFHNQSDKQEHEDNVKPVNCSTICPLRSVEAKQEETGDVGSSKNDALSTGRAGSCMPLTCLTKLPNQQNKREEAVKRTEVQPASIVGRSNIMKSITVNEQGARAGHGAVTKLGVNTSENRKELGHTTKIDESNDEESRKRSHLESNNIELLVGEILMVNFDPGGARDNDQFRERWRALIVNNEGCVERLLHEPPSRYGKALYLSFDPGGIYVGQNVKAEQKGTETIKAWNNGFKTGNTSCMKGSCVQSPCAVMKIGAIRTRHGFVTFTCSVPKFLSYLFDPVGCLCSLEIWDVIFVVVSSDSFVLNVTIGGINFYTQWAVGEVTANTIMFVGFMANELGIDLPYDSAYGMLMLRVTQESTKLTHDNKRYTWHSIKHSIGGCAPYFDAYTDQLVQMRKLLSDYDVFKCHPPNSNQNFTSLIYGEYMASVHSNTRCVFFLLDPGGNYGRARTQSTKLKDGCILTTKDAQPMWISVLAIRNQTKGLEKEIRYSLGVLPTQLELIIGATVDTIISWEEGGIWENGQNESDGQRRSKFLVCFSPNLWLIVNVYSCQFWVHGKHVYPSWHYRGFGIEAIMENVRMKDNNSYETESSFTWFCYGVIYSYMSDQLSVTMRPNEKDLIGEIIFTLHSDGVSSISREVSIVITSRSCLVGVPKELFQPHVQPTSDESLGIMAEYGSHVVVSFILQNELSYRPFLLLPGNTYILSLSSVIDVVVGEMDNLLVKYASQCFSFGHQKLLSTTIFKCAKVSAGSIMVDVGILAIRSDKQDSINLGCAFLVVIRTEVPRGQYWTSHFSTAGPPKLFHHRQYLPLEMNLQSRKFYITRGRVISLEGWNDKNNANMEWNFKMVKISVVLIDSSYVNVLSKIEQSRECSKLFHSVVNGLDPPKNLHGALYINVDP